MKFFLCVFIVFAFSQTTFGQAKNTKKNLNDSHKTQTTPHRDLSTLNLPETYTFTGNGNWSAASNWDTNGMPPPGDAISPGSKIVINSTNPGSKCILDIPYTFPNTTNAVTLSVNAGSELVVPDLIVK
ncbi:MAG: hypothetical protein ABI267_07080 [Ginsengibacter sp.]